MGHAVFLPSRIPPAMRNAAERKAMGAGDSDILHQPLHVKCSATL